MEYNNSFVFQDNTTTASIGNAFYPNKNNQVTIYITGTSTTHAITFDGCDAEGNWFNNCVLAAKLPSIDLESSTTGINEVWVIDTSFWVGIRINVTSISNGYIRVTGKAVDI